MNEDCRVDEQHLQSLPGIFASRVDLVLIARDGIQQVAFPVHQIIVAQHSSVLGCMLA